MYWVAVVGLVIFLHDSEEEFTCYTCEDGDNCRTINSSKLSKCVSPECCYTVRKKNSHEGNVYVTRGCANLELEKCNETCKNLEANHTKDASPGAAFNCTTCKVGAENGCNNEAYIPPLRCYDCESEACYDINNTNSELTDEPCETGCCLSARVYGNAVGFRYIRRCADDAANCSIPTCDEAELQQLKYDEHDDVGYCEKCNEFMCNRDPMEEPFNCYQCKGNCNNITDITPRHCRKASCCYTQHVKDSEAGDYYAIRGCMEWKSGKNCETACQEANERHYQEFKEGDEVCVSCTDTATSGCNNVTYEPQNIELSTGPNSIMCYSCKKDCNVVTYDTPRVRCAEDRCCYRAVWSEMYDEPLSAERGCMPHGGSCEKTCQYVEEKHRQRYPHGKYLVCTQCEIGDKDNCNGDDFILPKHVEPDNRKILAIRCYQCTGCERLLSITRNTHCRDPKCCYSAFLKDTDDGSYYTVRDCAEWEPGAPCDNTCEMVSKYHKLKHTNGSVYNCTTCKDNDWNECNRKVYGAPRNAERPMPIVCHMCSNCNDVDKFNQTTDYAQCPLSECCYRALLKKPTEKSFQVKRDCLKLTPGQTCNNTCQYIERNHYKMHGPGLFRVCKQCKKNDKDGCNGKRFYSAEESTEEQRQPGEISCYDCRHCSKVSHDTPTVECAEATCCYTAFLTDRPHQQQYAIRGCAPWRRGRSCEYTCKDLRSDHLWMHPYGVVANCRACKAGDVDMCNNYTLYEPKIITPESTQLMCYDCHNCYHVEDHTPTTECPAPQCCYTAHVKIHENDRFSVIRGCGKWDRENRCSKTCKEVENQHLWKNPFGKILKCNTCNDGDEDECNSQYYEAPITPTARPFGPSMLMCYQCRHCNTVNATTPRVRCQFPKCCYIVLVRNNPDEELHTVRGCASKYKPCRNNTCRMVRRQYLKEHNRGSFDFCKTCNTQESDECNNYNMSGIITVNSSKEIVRARKTVEAVNIINCYECRNCNEVVVAETQTNPCPSPKCCYVALVKDYTAQHQFAVRGCAQNCTTTCTNARTAYEEIYPESEFKLCLPCGETEGDACNDNIYKPPYI